MRLINLQDSPTSLGFRFRILRRGIKFLVGCLTLFYPLLVFTKIFFFLLAGYLADLVRFLYERGLIKNEIRVLFLYKFIVYLKLVFVWNYLPFELIFKPGFS